MPALSAMLAVLHVGRIGTMPKGQCPPTRRQTVARPCPISRTSRSKPNSFCAGIATVTIPLRRRSGRFCLAIESWRALKRGIDTMPKPADQTHSKPVIIATAAQLFVSDIQASCDFFTQKLGFSTVFVYGEPPFYAQVRRDAGRLNLRCVDAPVM